jgi:hypothetical protein
MLLLLILLLWALGLLLVAGLCFAARLGDDEQARAAALAAEQARPVQIAAERVSASRSRREIAA